MHQKIFINDWLDDPLFKDWLRKHEENTEARCIVCAKTIMLSLAGRSALTDHSKGKKHMEALNKRKTFFTLRSKKKSKSDIESSIVSNELCSNSQSTMQQFVLSTVTVKAEIVWSVFCGFSHRSCDELSDVFAKMFPDSGIAKGFKLGKTKALYTATHGIAPHFKHLLKDNLNKSEVMVYSFDECVNEITQTREMDLIIRYWNNHAQKVDVRYWGSSFFGHATHQDLLKQFMKIASELDPEKLYQISMDGPKFNTKFYGEIITNRVQSMFHKLIDFDSCNLHIVHGILKARAEKSDWKLKKTLKRAFQILHDTPARREDYVSREDNVSITGSTKYELFFCATW